MKLLSLERVASMLGVGVCFRPDSVFGDWGMGFSPGAGCPSAKLRAASLSGGRLGRPAGPVVPGGFKQSAWRDGKGDVVHDYVDSCRRAGIQPGVYAVSCQL